MTLDELIEANTTDCRACGRPIVFAESPTSGKIAPLVRATDQTGASRTGSFVMSEVGGTLIYHSGMGKPRWASHFADCPQADGFRHVPVRAHERRVPERPPTPADAPESRRRRDEGMDATERANALYSEWAGAAIRVLANTGQDFTSDDLERMRIDSDTEPPGHVNAVGAAFGAARRRGDIIPVGYTQTYRVSGHARAIRTWRRKA